MKFENKEAFEKANMFGTGTPNTAYAKYFIGDSFLNPLTDAECDLFAANVTFEPGCRNNWHIHHSTKVRKKTAGSATLPWRFRVKTARTNGASRSRTRNTKAAKNKN